MNLRMTEEALAAHQARVKGARTVKLLDKPKPAPVKIIIQPPPKKSKFNAKRIEIDGYQFASKKEGARYLELKDRLQRGEIERLRVQVSFPLLVNGEKICRYVADFVYSLPNGTVIVEDVKGMKAGLHYYVFTLKVKLMKAIHNIDVVEA